MLKLLTLLTVSGINISRTIDGTVHTFTVPELQYIVPIDETTVYTL